MKKNNQQYGFSLVEAIIYLAIVGILLTAVVTFHLTLGGTADKLTGNVLASRNRRVALGGINYLIKNSDGLLKDVDGDCSNFGNTPPSLALYFSDDTYLPGTCVENGGGVRISVTDKQISLACYPNMSGNGYYQNCDTSVYPVANVYYLSSPDVVVLNNSLSFATSTATSTANIFSAVTTNLSVGTNSANQIRLSATSTATSTTIVRNEQASGLVAWYKFDDASGLAAADSVGGYDLTCTGSPTAQSTALVGGSSYSFDFNSAESDYCYINNPDIFNFSNAFTITAWINRDYTSDVQSAIINKFDWTAAKGYNFYIYGSAGKAYFRLGDSSTQTDIISQDSIFANATVYHIALVYDLDNDKVSLYAYDKVAGTTSTTTASSIPTLVNWNHTDYPRIGPNFDGQIDELKIYNRALSDEEIWALQSQGA